MDDAALLLIWIAGCWPVLSGARLTPGDSLGAFFSQTSFVVNVIRHAEALWWNPYEYGGIPVLADSQSLLFTPQTLVGLIAGPAFNMHVFRPDYPGLSTARGLGSASLHSSLRRHALDAFLHANRNDPAHPIRFELLGGALVVKCISDAATVVVGDNYAPVWTACVNGAAVELLPYAGLFRSVPIQAGTSLIVMRYQPVPFLRGLACKSTTRPPVTNKLCQHFTYAK